MDIVITGLGAITPVGANAEQTCTSIRAGIAKFTEHAFYNCIQARDSKDEYQPLYTAAVSLIDPMLNRENRLLALAIPALAELISNAKLSRAKIKKGALFFALPQSDAIIKNIDLELEFISELCRRAGLGPFAMIRTNQYGHTGVFRLVDEAVELIRANEIEFCILGGVDSYLMEDRLDNLDNRWRIRSDRNVDGFIPGEGCVVILLEKLESANRRSCKPGLRINSIGFGMEPDTFESDRSSTGLGLASAVDATLTNSQHNQGYEWVCCDLNGESYRSFEWGVVLTRMGGIFGNLKTLVHPADCVGDVGAATGALLLATATQAFKRGYGYAEEALLWTSSDNGHRAALAVSCA